MLSTQSASPTDPIQGRDTKKRKRGRVATACKACNTRKQKCDGLLPCNNCSKRGLVDSCEFPADAKYPLPATTAADDPGAVQAAPGRREVFVWRTARDHNSSGPSQARHVQTSIEDGQPVAPLLSAEDGDAPAFYGSNYFGPRAAARVIVGGTGSESAPAAAQSAAAGSYKAYRTELDPFSQVSQVRDFVALLPRRKICDALVEHFFSDYNDHADIVWRPDFQAKYDRFWRRSFEHEDLAQVDMRWLALLFIVLAFGCLLEWKSEEGMPGLEEREEASRSWYWASRRAIVGAPTFYGESLDIVRAGCLVTWYLVINRRAPEAWLTIGFGVRFSQALGLHVDGERWGLSHKEVEIRRRLWAQIYVLDRCISLFLGRPLSIQNDQSSVSMPSNISDEELDDPPSVPHPLTHITRTTYLILNKSLTTVIGQMQNLCFGIMPTTHRHVLLSDEELVRWASELPAHFRLGDPCTNLDRAKPYLVAQRLSLHSRFHLTRISLHRPFLMRAIVGDSFQISRSIAIDSALDDLALRLQLSDADPLSRFQYMTVAGGFSSCTVLGTVLIREPSGRHSAKITRMLEAYLKQQQASPSKDTSLKAEIRVLEMCLARAEAARVELATRSNDSRPASRDHSGHAFGRLSSERQSFSRQSSPMRFFSDFTQNPQNGHAQTSQPVNVPSQNISIPHLATYRPEPLEHPPEPTQNFANWDPSITGFNMDPGAQTFDNFTNLQFPDNWEDWEDLIDRLTTTLPGNGSSFGNGSGTLYTL